MKRNLSTYELTKYIKKYKYWVIVAVLCSFANVIVQILIPRLMQQLMDNAVDKNMKEFGGNLIFSAGVIVLSVVIAYYEKFSTRKFNLSFVRDIKDLIAEHVVFMPIYELKKYTHGDIVSRMNNDLCIISNYYTAIPNVMFQPLLAIIAIVYMMLLSYKLTLASIILIPITSIIFNKINKPIEAHSAEVMKKSSMVNTLLEDVIKGSYIIKAFNLKDILTFKFMKVTEDIKVSSLKISKLNAWLTPVFLGLRLIPQLVYPLYGGYLAMHKEISMGSLFAFGILISYVFGPVESVLTFISQRREARPAFDRITQVLMEKLEKPDSKSVKLEVPIESIEFDNVSFAYESGKTTLSSISFSIPADSAAALVGPSGSGKSTIFKLICGFYKLDSGTIKINNKDFKQYDIESLRKNISYMSQECYLYPATISENIKLGKPGASDEEAVAAAKAANAHEFITELPDGYDTVIGDGGVNLSGGQSQRIALARLIVKDAQVILLDEPTSSLDMKSEALIQESLKKIMKGKIVINSAHRLTTVKNSEQIIVFENSCIKEYGTHNELIKADGLYKKLYMNQIDNEEQEALA